MPPRYFVRTLHTRPSNSMPPRYIVRPRHSRLNNSMPPRYFVQPRPFSPQLLGVTALMTVAECDIIGGASVEPPHIAAESDGARRENDKNKNGGEITTVVLYR